MTDIRAAAARWAHLDSAAGSRSTLSRSSRCYAEMPFSTQPFREPYRGRDGRAGVRDRALAEERGPRVWFSEPIVDGDRAADLLVGALREAGADATLAGTSVLRFDAEGLVIEQWDAWNQSRAAASRRPAGARYRAHDT